MPSKSMITNCAYSEAFDIINDRFFGHIADVGRLARQRSPLQNPALRVGVDDADLRALGGLTLTMTASNPASIYSTMPEPLIPILASSDPIGTRVRVAGFSPS